MVGCLLALFFATCGAQNFSLAGSPLETVVDSNGRLFVSTAGMSAAGEGGLGRIYRLSADTLREEEVIRLRVGDGVSSMRMALSYDQSRLVVCTKHSCSIYNSSDFSAGAQQTVKLKFYAKFDAVDYSFVFLLTTRPSNTAVGVYGFYCDMNSPTDGEASSQCFTAYWSVDFGVNSRMTDTVYNWAPYCDSKLTNVVGGIVVKSRPYFIAKPNNDYCIGGINFSDSLSVTAVNCPDNFNIIVSSTSESSYLYYTSDSYDFLHKNEVQIGTIGEITASLAFNVETFFLVYVAYTDASGNHLRAVSV